MKTWLDIVVSCNEVMIAGQTLQRPNWVSIFDWTDYWEKLRDEPRTEEQPAYTKANVDIAYQQGFNEGFEVGRRDALNGIVEKAKDWLAKPRRRTVASSIVLLALLFLAGCADDTKRFDGGEWVSARVARMSGDPCVVMVAIQSNQIGRKDLALMLRMTTAECSK